VNHHVALLRGVNLGKRTLKSDDLRALLAKSGFKDARTLLASGNIVLDPGKKSATVLETLLEAAILKQFGFTSEVFVRNTAEWRALIKANPFPKEAAKDPSRLIFFALRDAPPKGAEKALNDAIKGPEYVGIVGREAYLFYPDGQGQSTLTLTTIEKHLGTRFTGRNWNTVLKLEAMLDG
jgi:uncharacterized protein (DUF1697 family)